MKGLLALVCLVLPVHAALAIACTSVPAWDATTIYSQTGTAVTARGHIYQNKWWTRGEDPAKSGQWDVWADKGACESAPATPPSSKDASCRPEGLAVSEVTNVPYCLAYDARGLEKLANGLQRRNIGYFADWHTGEGGSFRYLASDIPWAHLTHVNYAFAHIGPDNRISVHGDRPGNAATDARWEGIKGAELDPSLPYKGHFNLLNKFKKQFPGVKTLISVGGWSATGGYPGPNGRRVNSGGFFSMTTHPDGSTNAAGINTFTDSVVAFVRQYGFDGADIDYEFPTTMPKSGHPSDWKVAASRQTGLQASYRELMRVMRQKLDAAAVQDGKYYLMTAAVPASAYLLRGMETFQALRYLDFVNVMSYDLHGTWSEFVGPQAPLFDDGRDAELISGKVYTDPDYKGIAALNVDWGYHYYRGALPPSRINIGLPYYTRGWRAVEGGQNGLWGSSISNNCPEDAHPPCGLGATGIDNIWFGVDEEGRIEHTGSNPLWHAKNLERHIPGDYLAQIPLGAADIVGSYTRHYDAALAAPWLWNAKKKVFLSIEDEQSIRAKADWVVTKGIGGVLHWELAGDYDWDPRRLNLKATEGQFVAGSTLTRLLAQVLRKARPANSRLSELPPPDLAVDVTVELTNFALGDANFPLQPTLRIVNLSGQPIPQGSLLRFQYPTSAPDNWVGADMVVTSGHTQSNVGGLKGDYHTVDFTLPSLAPGAAINVPVTYRLPITGPSNYRLIVQGNSFALRQEFPQLPKGTF